MRGMIYFLNLNKSKFMKFFSKLINDSFSINKEWDIDREFRVQSSYQQEKKFTKFYYDSKIFRYIYEILSEYFIEKKIWKLM